VQGTKVYKEEREAHSRGAGETLEEILGVAATRTSGERREDCFVVFIVVNKYTLFIY